MTDHTARAVLVATRKSRTIKLRIISSKYVMSAKFRITGERASAIHQIENSNLLKPTNNVLGTSPSEIPPALTDSPSLRLGV